MTACVVPAMGDFEWCEPSAVSGVARALGIQGAAARAGGVDLSERMRTGLKPPRLVGLGRVPQLRGIERAPGGGLRIGAAQTLHEVLAHPLVATGARALTEALALTSTDEVRRVATIGGNLLQAPRCAFYRDPGAGACLRRGDDACAAADGDGRHDAVFDNEPCSMVHPSTAATALVALRAKVRLVGGERSRLVPLDGFFVHPKESLETMTRKLDRELVSTIEVPPCPRGTSSAHLRQSAPQGYEWPAADVAVVLRRAAGVVRSARIVLGAAAAVPHVSAPAEEMLVGHRVDPERADRAARAALAGATPGPGSGYKLLLFRSLIRRALMQATR